MYYFHLQGSNCLITKRFIIENNKLFCFQKFQFLPRNSQKSLETKVFFSFLVGHNRRLLAGYSCHILVLYNHHLFVQYICHILVGYKRHIPWSKFEKYWTPSMNWHIFLYQCYYADTARNSVSPLGVCYKGQICLVLIFLFREFKGELLCLEVSIPLCIWLIRGHRFPCHNHIQWKFCKVRTLARRHNLKTLVTTELIL